MAEQLLGPLLCPILQLTELSATGTSNSVNLAYLVENYDGSDYQFMVWLYAEALSALILSPSQLTHFVRWVFWRRREAEQLSASVYLRGPQEGTLFALETFV